MEDDYEKLREEALTGAEELPEPEKAQPEEAQPWRWEEEARASGRAGEPASGRAGEPARGRHPADAGLQN